MSDQQAEQPTEPQTEPQDIVWAVYGIVDPRTHTVFHLSHGVLRGDGTLSHHSEQETAAGKMLAEILAADKRPSFVVLEKADSEEKALQGLAFWTKAFVFRGVALLSTPSA